MSVPRQGSDEFPFRSNVSDAEFLHHMDSLAARSSPTPPQGPFELEDSTENLQRNRVESANTIMTVFPGFVESPELADDAKAPEPNPAPKVSPQKSPSAHVNKPFPPLPPWPARGAESVGVGSPLKFEHKQSASQGSIEYFGHKAVPSISKQSTEIPRPSSAMKHSAEIPRPGSALKYRHHESPKTSVLTPPTFSSKGKRKQPPMPLNLRTPESPSSAAKARGLQLKPSLENISSNVPKRGMIRASRSVESLRTPFRTKKPTVQVVVDTSDLDHDSPCPPSKKSEDNRMGTFRRLVLNRFRSDDATSRNDIPSDELPRILVDPKGNRTRRYEEENPRLGSKKQDNKGVRNQGVQSEPINEGGSSSRHGLIKEPSASKKVEIQQVPRVESQRVVPGTMDDQVSTVNAPGLDAIPRRFRPSMWLDPAQGIWENNSSVGHTLLPFSPGLPQHPAFRGRGGEDVGGDGASFVRPQVVSESMGTGLQQTTLKHNSWVQESRESGPDPHATTAAVDGVFLSGMQQSLHNIEQGLHYYLEGSLDHVIRHITNESNRTTNFLVERINTLEAQAMTGAMELETVKGELLQQRQDSSERLAGVLNAVNLAQSFGRTAASKYDLQSDAIALLGEKQHEIQNFQSQLSQDLKTLLETAQTSSATGVFVAQQQQQLGEKTESLLNSLRERMTSCETNCETFIRETKWFVNTVNCRMTEDFARLKEILSKLDEMDARISPTKRARRRSNSAGTVQGMEPWKNVDDWRNVTGSTNIVEKAMLFEPGVEHRPPASGGGNHSPFAEALSRHDERPNYRAESPSGEGTVRRRRAAPSTPANPSCIEEDGNVFDGPPSTLILRPKSIFELAESLKSHSAGGMDFEISKRHRDISKSVYSQDSGNQATGNQAEPKKEEPETPDNKKVKVPEPKTPEQKRAPEPRTPPPRGFENATMRVMSGPFGMKFEVPEDPDGEYTFF